MSGRKNKNKHRGQRHQHQQQGNSTELLDELHSIRELLGSDELGDIPLLDQVAEAASALAPEPITPVAPPQRRQPVPEPLDESELPILFSPVDEALPEDYKTELTETEKALLRPLQNLPGNTSAPVEQQGELFAYSEPTAPPENPFLPAHIRARLTGGRVPRSPEGPDSLAQPTPTAEPQQTTNDSSAAEASEASGAPERAQPPSAKPANATPRGESESSESAAATAAERAAQRKQLVDRLVAKQLPELERQLRARIEQMIDELEAKR